MAIQCIDPKDSLFLNETQLTLNGVHYHERMYFLVEDYTFNGNTIINARISVISDIKSYLEKTKIELHPIQFDTPDMPNVVADAVKECQNILNSNHPDC